jgi:hypothetical protein
MQGSGHINFSLSNILCSAFSRGGASSSVARNESSSASLLKKAGPHPPDGRRLVRVRKAPLKLAGLFLSISRPPGFYMTVKSAEEYRAQARNVRQLAERQNSPEERQTLLDIAESYERLAQQSDMLAKAKSERQSD